MKQKIELPPAKIMQEMSRLAVESATTKIALFARMLANDPRMKTLTGDEALRAFADAIIQTNKASFTPTIRGQ